MPARPRAARPRAAVAEALPGLACVVLFLALAVRDAGFQPTLWYPVGLFLLVLLTLAASLDRANARTDGIAARHAHERFVHHDGPVGPPGVSRVESAAGAATNATRALEGANHMVGALLMLTALVYAWRLNRRVDVTITGPYRVQARSI